MNRCILLLVLLLAAGGVLAQSPTIEGAELFDSALAQRGLTSDEVRFDRDEMATWGGDKWRLSYFTLLHQNPFKLPGHGEVLSEDLIAGASDPTKLLVTGSRLIDHPIRRGLVGDPLENYLVFPDTIPKPSITRDKNILTGGQYASLKDGIDLIYALAEDDEHLFKRGLGKVNKDKYRERLFDYFINEKEDLQKTVYEMLEKIDFDLTLAGAQDFAEAARRLADSDSPAFPKAKTEIKTRKGLIVVGTAGDDVFEYYNPPLLIVDGGGNDVYRLSGYPNGYPASIIVDLAGDDQYLSADTAGPGLGGAILGISILIDREGNDRYESKALAQGAG
ncbi:MAG: hypothetical protein GY867_02865, partial [bacterium]|nr:hypothetical protein [bacterium]